MGLRDLVVKFKGYASLEGGSSIGVDSRYQGTTSSMDLGNLVGTLLDGHYLINQNRAARAWQA